MTYFKVKRCYDNLPISGNGKYIGFLIENELYTQSEIDKFLQKGVKWESFKMAFDKIELPKKQRVFVFGKRIQKTY